MIDWEEVRRAHTRLKDFSEKTHVIIYPEFWLDLETLLDAIDEFAEDQF